jgi:hypothetical protein
VVAVDGVAPVDRLVAAKAVPPMPREVRSTPAPTATFLALVLRRFVIVSSCSGRSYRLFFQ